MRSISNAKFSEKSPLNLHDVVTLFTNHTLSFLICSVVILVNYYTEKIRTGKVDGFRHNKPEITPMGCEIRSQATASYNET